MKFYNFSSSIDDAIIGKYPQGKRSIVQGNIEQLYGVTVPDTEGLILPELLLMDKTIITDYIQVVTVHSSFFLILNEKFKTLLNNFNVGKTNSFAIKMHHKKRIVASHSILYLLESKEDICVNYSESSFYTGTLKDYKYKGEAVKINNSIDFRFFNDKLLSEGLYLKCSKLHLNFSNIKSDLIKNQFMTSTTF